VACLCERLRCCIRADEKNGKPLKTNHRKLSSEAACDLVRKRGTACASCGRIMNDLIGLDM